MKTAFAWGPKRGLVMPLGAQILHGPRAQPCVNPALAARINLSLHSITLSFLVSTWCSPDLILKPPMLTSSVFSIPSHPERAIQTKCSKQSTKTFRQTSVYHTGFVPLFSLLNIGFNAWLTMIYWSLWINVNYYYGLINNLLGLNYHRNWGDQVNGPHPQRRPHPRR